MSDLTPLKVTARLATQIAGDLPMLDALIELHCAHLQGLARDIRRDEPCPPYGHIRVPFLRRKIGGVLVPCCSSPIVAGELNGVGHFAKRLAVEHAPLLAENERRQVAMGNATYKAYRLPLRTRLVDRVVWFVVGNRKEILKLVKQEHALGKKRSQGFGRVAEWTVERVEHDWSWFADSDAGPVLMRPLPWCEELPLNIVGAARDFGACQSPMWHPERYREIVVPC